MAAARMDALFRLMADFGSSDLHLSVSMPPMVRMDGKMQKLECGEGVLTEDSMRELLLSIMPHNNQDEFERRHDTDFAYEIAGLARFRCNVFYGSQRYGRRLPHHSVGNSDSRKTRFIESVSWTFVRSQRACGGNRADGFR
jgi:Tfp pilus assembly pilus retraction ATPase PilT